ncbi:MAG: N-acetyl-gamma-glutamyl-phosphate reductase, partial [Firmicutes bacterium]|nr:N-acetyl-gamma-glutamyl-phosphate reductase [Bacillota bacterium]
PRLSLTAVLSAHEAGQPTAPYFFASGPEVFTHPEAFDPHTVDVILTSGSAKQAFPALLSWAEAGCRIIDLSADFRFADVRRYESAYGPHPAPHLLSASVSGYADDCAMEYKAAQIIGNPGCYPTAFFSAVAPLVHMGMKPELLMVDGKSGVTGAGRLPKVSLMLAEMSENFAPYALPGRHRHTLEMEDVAHTAVVFQPHLLPVARGLELTIFWGNAEISAEQVRRQWRQYFEWTPFVQVLPEGSYPHVARVQKTNMVELQAAVDDRTQTLVLTAAIDNLGKGAAGQAIEHLNRWMGWPLEWGLD